MTWLRRRWSTLLGVLAVEEKKKRWYGSQDQIYRDPPHTCESALCICDCECDRRISSRLKGNSNFIMIFLLVSSLFPLAGFVATLTIHCYFLMNRYINIAGATIAVPLSHFIIGNLSRCSNSAERWWWLALGPLPPFVTTISFHYQPNWCRMTCDKGYCGAKFEPEVAFEPQKN